MLSKNITMGLIRVSVLVPLMLVGCETKQPINKMEPVDKFVSGSEKQEYQQAYNQLRNGNTKESIEQFNAFLIKHPSGLLYANNAQYWLGEAYRVDQNNDAARKAFNDVIEKYPDGVKVPDALLRLGMLEMEQGNNGKAIEYFVRVATEYPNSTVAPIAEKKLHTLGVTEIKKIDKPIKLKPKQAVIPPASNSTVDNKEMPKKTTSVNFDEFKAQCKELGFKAGTQDFGNCVLQLNEGK